MSTRNLIMTLVALFIVVAVGAWMGGLFDPETQDDDLGPVPQRVQDATVEDNNPSGEPGTGVVSTSGFDPNSEAEAPVASGGGESEGGGYQLVAVVMASDGGPVPAARVDLMRDNGTIPSVHQLGELVATEETDANGKVTFDGLEPGDRMVLRASHDDYAMARAYGIDAANRTSLSQVITMVRGLRFSGTVKHKDGRPLQGVRVACYDVNVQAYEPEDQLERDVFTEADGSYQMPAVSKGIKRVAASQQGLTTVVHPAIQVPVDRAEGVQFVMEDGFVIEGSVLAKGTGQVVEGARVMCRAAGARQGNRGSSRIESTLTDRDGRYTLIGLRGGPHEVWARGKAHLQSPRQIVQAGAVNVVVEVPPAASIAGRVLDAETNAPIERFTVLITANPDIIIATGPNRRRFTSPDGAFALKGVQPSKLYVAARAPGYAEQIEGPFTLSEGLALTDVVVKLGRGATVAGEVIDSASNGIEGARVTFKRTNIDASKPEHIFIGALANAHAQTITAVTDSEGRYEVSGFRRGTWTLRAEHPLYATDREIRMEVSATGRQECRPMVLAKAGGIRGIVRTEGKPDPNARITISNLNDPSIKFDTSTGKDGRFERLGIPPGNYRVQVVQRNGVVDLGGLLGAMAAGQPQTVHSVLAGRVLDVEL